MIYVYLVVGALVLGLGAWGKYEQTRADGAEAQVQALGAKIEQQNQAVEQTKADGDRRVAEAQKGLKIASATAQGYRSEAQRLRSMVGQPTPAGNCPAGLAVAELRKGLK